MCMSITNHKPSDEWLCADYRKADIRAERLLTSPLHHDNRCPIHGERWDGEREGFGACGVHGCTDCT